MRLATSTKIVRTRSIAANTRASDADQVEPKVREALERKARKPIGARIARAVEEVGFTRGRASELARILGVTPNTVYRLRRGAMAPSIFTLASIARLTGHTMESLMSDFSPPTMTVLIEWRAKNSVSDERYAMLEQLDLGGRTPTIDYYNVANAALDNGATLSTAARTAASVLPRGA